MLLLIPGSEFVTAQKQTIPCDNSIQLPDNSQQLTPRDASAFRSIVGLCLYAGRERHALMFGIKELAAKMASPTVSSVQHLRQLVGYVKQVGDLGVFLHPPVPGQDKCVTRGEHVWLLETYADADWSSNKSHRRSTSCRMRFMNSNFIYGSSRSQKTISLSSCESELQSMMSALCDRIYIVACAKFVFGEEAWRTLFTDSSSGRVRR